MRSLIPTFSACLGLETHDFAQRLLKIQTFFSEFQGSENPPKCPKLWSLDFLGPACHDWRPRAILVLGVHRGAFAQQKLRRRDLGVEERRVVERRRTSGRFLSGAVGRCGRSRGKRRTLWAAELYYPFNRQTNDECFGFNIFKTVQNKKQITNTQLNKFQYTSFLQHHR